MRLLVQDIRGLEARFTASSTQDEDPVLELSGVRCSSIEAGELEDLPPYSPPFKELLEVVTIAVAKLNIKWPTEKQEVQKKIKLDERFLQSRAQPSRRSLPFFPDLHTKVLIS